MDARYQRHFQLKEVGEKGQLKLKESKVLVVGAGGLGCPALQYLTAAGIGTIGIIDPDVVSISNLQRQILFDERDLGKNKALTAKKKLKVLNSKIKINTYPTSLSADNASELIAKYDIILDGTDNFYTRYLINDACILNDKIMVYGAIYKFEGQVTVFNYKEGPSYRCLFPDPPQLGEVPNCSEVGVLGVVPGLIGLYQALEVIKIILELGGVLSGKLLCINLKDQTTRNLYFNRNKEEIKKIKNQGTVIPILNKDCFLDFELSLTQLSSSERIKWIDVREVEEYPQLKQLNSLSASVNLDSLMDSKEKIIAFCQSGQRSKLFIEKLLQKGVTNCYSLKEGALELQKWIK